MSAIANIMVASSLTNATADQIRVISNDDAVAADKTYSPAGSNQAGLFRWVDRSGGIDIGLPSYSLTFSENPKSPVRRVRERISLPVLNITAPSTTSGIQPLPSVGHEYVCTREWLIPRAGTPAERLMFLALCASFHAIYVHAKDGAPTAPTGSPLHAAILTGEQPW